MLEIWLDFMAEILQKSRVSTHSDTIRLLHGAFTKEEWDYLSNHESFKLHLAKDDGSTKSYESLVDVGSLLLQQRKELGLER